MPALFQFGIVDFMMRDCCRQFVRLVLAQPGDPGGASDVSCIQSVSYSFFSLYYTHNAVVVISYITLTLRPYVVTSHFFQ